MSCRQCGRPDEPTDRCEECEMINFENVPYGENWSAWPRSIPPSEPRDDMEEADAVHGYLVRHNLRAVPGNFDGKALYGLPASMNVTGYEGKTEVT